MVGQDDAAVRGARAGGRRARVDGECGGDGWGADGDGGGVGGLVEGGGGDEEGGVIGLVGWSFRGPLGIDLATPNIFSDGEGLLSLREGRVISVIFSLSLVANLLQYTPWISWICLTLYLGVARRFDHFYDNILALSSTVYELIYLRGV